MSRNFELMANLRYEANNLSIALPAPIPHPGEQMILTDELMVQRGKDVDAQEQGHQVSRQPVDQP